MLSVVLLSLSAAFAVNDDNATDVIAIEDNSEKIAVDDVDVDKNLAAEDDSSVIGDGEATVTKDNFKNYFDENGALYNNVTADELKFDGDISDVGVDTIKLNRTIKISGDAVLTNISIDVKAKNVVISGITINQNKGSAAITISDASDVTVENTKINFNANKESEGFAINADFADNLKLLNNVITYVGATNGSTINNAIRVSNSDDIKVSGNKVKAKLVSSYVPWDENWVSHPVSEGIVIEESDNAVFENNNVSVEYGDIVGLYDTIYSVDFKNTNNALISKNNITSNGNSYIYGIIITGDNFTIDSNHITSVGNYYADGIDIEGPATGVVKNNNIDVKSQGSAYAIYSGMNGADVKANYTNNNITGNSYNIFGMSLGDVESNVLENFISLEGNYTTGIAYKGVEASIKKNLIVLISSEIGNESVSEGLGVESVGIKVIKGNVTVFNNTIATQGKGLHIAGNESNVDVEDNFINVVGNTDKNAYAIYVNDSGAVVILDNTVDYQGTTNGTGINNAVFIYQTDDVVIARNKFDLDLVSAHVNWVEEPAGSWNYVSYPVSEGIVVEESNDVLFEGNVVNVKFTDVVGSDDTIYSVDFKNSNDAVILDNEISSNGSKYIYGIIITGDNFAINGNNITSVGNYYANGIDVEGPASGVISNNGISAVAPNSAYPIYSGMNFKPVSVNITGNDVVGEAYYAVGVELGGQEAIVKDNNINVKGNHTIGIASNVDKLTVDNNQIVSDASNKGNETIQDSFGTNTTGIKVASGNATISNNNVKTTGDYAIDVDGTHSTIKPNYLESAKGTGEKAIASSGNATIDVKIKTAFEVPASSTVLTTEAKSGYNVKIVLKDANGLVLAKTPITVNGNAFTTDDNGVVNYKLTSYKAGTQTLTINYAGDDQYAATSATSKVVINKEATKIAAKKKTFKAKKKTKKYTVTLKDSKGKAISKVKLTLKIKGKKAIKAKTNAKGKAVFKIKKLTKKGKYKAKVKYAGSALYKASSKTVKIKVKK